MSARKGKIARLPHAIRAKINERLRDGIPQVDIVHWLNTLPEVRAVMQQCFAGADINSQNLTEWRQGGYKDWLIEVKQYDEARQTTDHARYICSSLGLDPSDALSVIITGHLVNLLSGTADLEDLAKLGPLFNAVTNVKKAGIAERKIDIAAEDLQLRQKRFQRDTLELFQQWWKDERANTIMGDDTISSDEKTEMLGNIIFGEDW